YTADESFMTGTPFCLLPVTSLNNISIGNKKMGKVTKMLLDKWGKNVGVDIAKQIKRYNKILQKSRAGAPTPYSF
ncbi:branched-chain amino acid aminotransferase, partial [bacterium]|nr:branched-chain amino acid aminotransferase [bacterium]